MSATIFGKKKKKGKVMVVEDDLLLAQVLGKRLEEEGYEVLIVGNGLEALPGAIKFNPNIILLDLILPGIDGYAVLKQLKANEQTRQIPVSIISNLGAEGDVKSAKALGALEYFIKANTEMKEIISFVNKQI